MSSEPRAWWSRRWLDTAVGDDPSYARPRQRGQALARRGWVGDVVFGPGRITARVAEHRGRGQEVELRWEVPDAGAWHAAVTMLADQLRFTAALLEGTLPEGIDELLAGAGIDLYEGARRENQRCTCDEPGPPCRHLVALHSVAVGHLDRDPLLLLELAGRSRERLLHDLRSMRGGSGASAMPEIDLSRGLFEARGDLDAIEVRPAPVDDPGAVLLHLGPPPGMPDTEPLERVVGRAADAAWRLAAGHGAEAADEELLLAELRAQRTATAASLAQALGREADTVREHLDRLFEDGTVLRTGAGEDARYRAARTS